MREARIVSIEVRQKAARARKLKFEAHQQTTRTGAYATIGMIVLTISYIIAQYV